MVSLWADNIHYSKKYVSKNTRALFGLIAEDKKNHFTGARTRKNICLWRGSNAGYATQKQTLRHKRGLRERHNYHLLVSMCCKLVTAFAYVITENQFLSMTINSLFFISVIICNNNNAFIPYSRVTHSMESKYIYSNRIINCSLGLEFLYAISL